MSVVATFFAQRLLSYDSFKYSFQISVSFKHSLREIGIVKKVVDMQ